MCRAICPEVMAVGTQGQLGHMVGWHLAPPCPSRPPREPAVPSLQRLVLRDQVPSLPFPLLLLISSPPCLAGLSSLPPL